MLHRLPKGLLILGDVLRRRREERQLSRAELAELSGVTTKTIQRAEADGPVSPAVVRELCRLLGLELVEVMRPTYAEVSQRLLACGRAPAAPPDEWVCRDAEVVKIVSILGWNPLERDGPQAPDGRHRLCAIAGPPGIGKTALAQYVVAPLASHFPDGIAWLDASHLDSPARIATSQRDIAGALGFGALLPGADSSPRDLAQAFRQHFSSRRRLLVMDDVSNPECLEAFVATGAGCKVLFTTHSRRVAERAGCTIVEVGPVAPDVVRAVLDSHVGPGRLDHEDRDTASLVALVASAPGAIHLTGRLLLRESFTRPADLVRRAEESGLIDVTEVTESGSHHLGGWWEQSLFRSFAALRPALSSTAWHIWTTLSVLGSCTFPSAYASDLCELSPEASLRGLSELFDHFLLKCPDVVAHSSNGERLICFDAHSAAAAQVVLGPARGLILERLVGLIVAAAKDSGLPGWVAGVPKLADRCRAGLSSAREFISGLSATSVRDEVAAGGVDR